MSDQTRTRITEILTGLGPDQDPSKDCPPPAELLALVYQELREMAGRMMQRERRDHTLQSTALVHEAFTRLVDQSRVQWQGGSHFRAVAAQAMRRILIDHARGKKRDKRGEGWERVSMAHALVPAAGQELDAEQLLALNRSLEKLAQLDPRQAKIVELRFFGGLTVTETARCLGISSRTVEGDWTHAKTWLRRDLTSET